MRSATGLNRSLYGVTTMRGGAMYGAGKKGTFLKEFSGNDPYKYFFHEYTPSQLEAEEREFKLEGIAKVKEWDDTSDILLSELKRKNGVDNIENKQRHLLAKELKQKSKRKNEPVYKEEFNNKKRNPLYNEMYNRQDTKYYDRIEFVNPPKSYYIFHKYSNKRTPGKDEGYIEVPHGYLLHSPQYIERGDSPVELTFRPISEEEQWWADSNTLQTSTKQKFMIDYVNTNKAEAEHRKDLEIGPMMFLNPDRLSQKRLSRIYKLHKLYKQGLSIEEDEKEQDPDIRAVVPEEPDIRRPAVHEEPEAPNIFEHTKYEKEKTFAQLEKELSKLVTEDTKKNPLSFLEILEEQKAEAKALREAKGVVETKEQQKERENAEAFISGLMTSKRRKTKGTQKEKKAPEKKEKKTKAKAETPNIFINENPKYEKDEPAPVADKKQMIAMKRKEQERQRKEEAKAKAERQSIVDKEDEEEERAFMAQLDRKEKLKMEDNRIKKEMADKWTESDDDYLKRVDKKERTYKIREKKEEKAEKDSKEEKAPMKAIEKKAEKKAEKKVEKKVEKLENKIEELKEVIVELKEDKKEMAGAPSKKIKCRICGVVFDNYHLMSPVHLEALAKRKTERLRLKEEDKKNNPEKYERLARERKQRANAWITHLKAYRQANPDVSYKVAMQQAKATYNR